MSIIKDADNLVAITNKTELPVFGNEFLDNTTKIIFDLASGVVSQVTNAKREIAIQFAYVSDHKDDLKAAGFKSVKEYGEKIGYNRVYSYQLAKAGRLYLDQRLPDSVKNLPVTSIVELAPMLKVGKKDDDMVNIVDRDSMYSCIDNDASAISQMSQSQLRDYAKTAVANKATIIDEYATQLADDSQDDVTVSVLDIKTRDTESVNPTPISGKVAELYTPYHLGGSAKLTVFIDGKDGSNVDYFDDIISMNDTFDGIKTTLTEWGYTVFNVKPDTIKGISHIKKEKFLLVLSPFGDAATFWLKPDMIKPSKPALSQIDPENMKTAGMDLATGRIDYVTFQQLVADPVLMSAYIENREKEAMLDIDKLEELDDTDDTNDTDDMGIDLDEAHRVCAVDDDISDN